MSGHHANSKPPPEFPGDDKHRHQTRQENTRQCYRREHLHRTFKGCLAAPAPTTITSKDFLDFIWTYSSLVWQHVLFGNACFYNTGNSINHIKTQVIIRDNIHFFLIVFFGEKNVNANAISFASIYPIPSFVKLIAKLLAIKIDKNYTLEKGGSGFEAQHHTKNGH